jgi:hypothetical protein
VELWAETRSVFHGKRPGARRALSTNPEASLRFSAAAQPACSLGSDEPVDELTARSGSCSFGTQEKLEGLAIAKDGRVYTVTDNDGVDGNTGETQFLRLGRWPR